MECKKFVFCVLLFPPIFVPPFWFPVSGRIRALDFRRVILDPGIFLGALFVSGSGLQLFAVCEVVMVELNH